VAANLGRLSRELRNTPVPLGRDRRTSADCSCQLEKQVIGHTGRGSRHRNAHRYGLWRLWRNASGAEQNLEGATEGDHSGATGPGESQKSRACRGVGFPLDGLARRKRCLDSFRKSNQRRDAIRRSCRVGLERLSLPGASFSRRSLRYCRTATLNGAMLQLGQSLQRFSSSPGNLLLAGT
jgi:hypothetical protein